MKRGHSPPPPPFGYPMDGMGGGGAKEGLPPPRLPRPQDFDADHYQSNLYDFQPQHLPPPDFVDPADMVHPVGYPPAMNPRDAPHQHRLPPAAYRSGRDQAVYQQQQNLPEAGPSTASAPYKILCITNINHKVSDNPVKEALINDFSRFGDISVSICHDSGERLAYIYFRSYEEARQARHAKTRTLFFDRPLEIEPIYDPRASSPVNPNLNLQNQQYTLRARRSITPPDHYDGSPLPPHSRRLQPMPPQAPPSAQMPLPPYHRDMHSPNYHHPRSSYPPAPPVLDPPVSGYNRHYPKHNDYDLLSNYEPNYRVYSPPAGVLPYGSPIHDPALYSEYCRYPVGPPQAPSYPHSMRAERLRLHDSQMNPGNLRHEQYHRSDPRDYPPPPSIQLPPEDIEGVRLNVYRGYPRGSRLPTPPPPAPLPSDRHPPVRSFMSREFRREKYGPDAYNTNSLEPEEGRPSRILFVTNIDQLMSDEEVRKTFEPFGTIEEMEVRKILDSDISSCLIKFSSMDCAYRAKTAINGKYLASSKKPWRVAYGKLSTSKRLWIGGLGSATTVTSLQDEFKKFGNIVNLDYISGRPYAYVEYESANQAQLATHHLKGTIVAGADRKIRIEYVDSLSERTNDNSRASESDTISKQQNDTVTRSQSNNESWAPEPSSSPATHNSMFNSSSGSAKRSISPSSTAADPNLKRHHINERKYSSDHQGSIHSPDGHTQLQNRSAVDRQELNNNLKVAGNETVPTKNGRDLDMTQEVSIRPRGSDSLNNCDNIARIVDCCPVSWYCQLVLRNFSFSCKMSLCSGEQSIIDKYIAKLNGVNGENGSDSWPALKITQRWRLNPQPKLEEVRRKMQTANFGIIIMTPASMNQSSPLSSASPASFMKTPQTPIAKQNGDDKDMDMERSNNLDSPTTCQSRPLKNLISYLEQKDAAGVISLKALDEQEGDAGESSSKLLYAFPPGEFAMNLLKLKAENLSQEATKEEFLLGVIV